jgi:hypothetical protein
MSQKIIAQQPGSLEENIPIDNEQAPRLIGAKPKDREKHKAYNLLSTIALSLPPSPFLRVTLIM